MLFFFTDALLAVNKWAWHCMRAADSCSRDYIVVCYLARAVPLFKYYERKEGSHALYLLLNRYTVTN